jgi:hypothetical protein
MTEGHSYQLIGLASHAPQNLEMHRPIGYRESVLVRTDSRRLGYHHIIVVGLGHWLT